MHHVCQSMEEMVSSVVNDLRVIRNKSISDLEGLISELNDIRGQLKFQQEVESRKEEKGDTISAEPSSPGESSSDFPISPRILKRLKETVEMVPSCVNTITTNHRNQCYTLGNVEKVIDNNFELPEDAYYLLSGYAVDLFENRFTPKWLIGEAIFQHLYMESKAEVAEIFASEMKLKSAKIDAKRVVYQTINQILFDLQNEKLESALQWSMENRRELFETDSILEFKLHQAAFINILKCPSQLKQKEAVAYAQKHFQIFGEKHQKEIRTLMMALVYGDHKLSKKTEAVQSFVKCQNVFEDGSPDWYDLQKTFLQDASFILGVPVISALKVCVSAGLNLIPQKLQFRNTPRETLMYQVRFAQNGLRWRRALGGFAYIHLDAKLEKNLRFHSVGFCPIAQYAGIEENPVMRLACGHAISLAVLVRVSHNGTYRCPYCPTLSQPLLKVRQIQL